MAASLLCSRKEFTILAGVAIWAFWTVSQAAGVEGPSRPAALSSRAWAANVILPQARAFDMAQRGAVQVTEIDAAVSIREQVAVTTLEIALRNPTGRRLEAEMLVPVPSGSVVRRFTFQGAASEPTAELLPREEARHVYDGIVAKLRDPALLEFAGYNLIRSSVFPVEAGGQQKVRLTYENLLEADGTRVDYVLPRSESLAYSVPWRISVQIQHLKPVTTIYSPSHKLEVRRSSDGKQIRARTADEAAREAGPFRLSYLLNGEGVTASLLAYPDPSSGGGYFLLLAGAPARPSPESEASPIKREVTLVLDHSGSMAGEKIQQVREAARQVVEGLQDGEAFNLIYFNEGVESFAPAPVLKSAETLKAARAYLKSLTARGGTNIHDALVEALRPPPARGFLPLVLFLTDGLPTVGKTAETTIRDLALKSNPHKRRIFTFGVGVDVNTPLLEKIAEETRALPTFILPKEDVELKVGQVFKRLEGPVLADPELEVITERHPDLQLCAKDALKDALALGRVTERLPRRLPDLFEGDQLVLLGRYTGDAPLAFRLKGNYLGRERTFAFRFGLEQASTKNAFVPRLWASRKIAELVDAIRQLGAGGAPGMEHTAARPDPRLKELVDEIVKLSTEFGILTEYTAFLAREGTDLSNKAWLNGCAWDNLKNRAMDCRSGWGSVNQSLNNGAQKGQSCLNGGNRYFDENMKQVAITSVQQVGDRTFFKRGERWVDSRVVGKEGEARPDKVVKYGSPEFEELMERLVKEGRQGCLAVGNEVLLRDEKLQVNYQVSW